MFKQTTHSVEYASTKWPKHVIGYAQLRSAFWRSKVHRPIHIQYIPLGLLIYH